MNGCDGHVVDPNGVEAALLDDFAGFTGFAGKRVLEIGCGDGRVTLRYAAPTQSVLAIDPNGERIELARARLPPELAEKVRYEPRGVGEIALVPRTFDTVLFAHSL